MVKPLIQHIGPHIFHNEWDRFTPELGDKIYFFHGHDVLTDPDGHLPRFHQVCDLKIPEYRYLFAIDDQHYFLAWTADKVTLEGFCYHPARDLRRQRPMEKALSGFTATHLNSWYRSNRFCGRCGGGMVPGSDERKMVCPHCGNLIYPRLNPAIIVAVTDGERLLMTKYSPRSGHNVFHYVLIAGFVEIGETAEQAVHREVMEEVGLRVKNIRYFGSQPWGIDGNLTLGYFAELDRSGGDQVHVDEAELSDGRWVERSEDPVPDDDLSNTSAMIHHFAAGSAAAAP